MSTDVLLALMLKGISIGLFIIAILSLATGLRKITLANNSFSMPQINTSVQPQSLLSLRLTGVSLCFLACACGFIAMAFLFTGYTHETLIFRCISIFIAVLFIVASVFLSAESRKNALYKHADSRKGIFLLLNAGICLLLGPITILLLNSLLSYILLGIELIGTIIFAGSFLLLRRIYNTSNRMHD